MSTPLLSITCLQKSFGARRLLDLKDLQVASGALVVLTGDNGSGKSTLLRILAGLEPADTLDATYRGLSLAQANRREIVYVHQHPYLFNRSIADNIDYGLRIRNQPPEERGVAVADAMNWAGLDAVAQVPPKRLSGGEKQKVALARAKVLHPRLWLVDEPTANLDRAARTQITSLLRSAADVERDSALIIACHDQEIIDLDGVTRWHLEAGEIRVD